MITNIFQNLLYIFREKAGLIFKKTFFLTESLGNDIIKPLRKRKTNLPKRVTFLVRWIKQNNIERAIISMVHYAI